MNVYHIYKHYTSPQVRWVKQNKFNYNITHSLNSKYVNEALLCCNSLKYVGVALLCNLDNMSF